MNEKNIITNRRDDTNNNIVNNDIITSIDKTESKEDVDEYIKGPDKFPLQQNRYGYLPFILQTFIGTDNKKCQVSITNKNLKKKT